MFLDIFCDISLLSWRNDKLIFPVYCSISKTVTTTSCPICNSFFKSRTMPVLHSDMCIRPCVLSSNITKAPYGLMPVIKGCLEVDGASWGRVREWERLKFWENSSKFIRREKMPVVVLFPFVGKLKILLVFVFCFRNSYSGK